MLKLFLGYLHPAEDNLRKITKADKDFAKKTWFWRYKVPIKVRDIHKIAKNFFINISIFRYENKEKYPIYVSKKCFEETHVDLLLKGKKGKMHYVFIMDFNTSLYNHSLHRGR